MSNLKVMKFKQRASRGCMSIRRRNCASWVLISISISSIGIERTFGLYNTYYMFLISGCCAIFCLHIIEFATSRDRTCYAILVLV